MEMRKITAIIRGSVLEKVEGRLQDMGVKGISVTQVKGYGEYANLSRSDWMVSHVKLEIFTEKSQVEQLVSAIMEVAHLGIAGDGIVGIQPVEKFYRIRTKSEITDDEV